MLLGFCIVSSVLTVSKVHYACRWSVQTWFCSGGFSRYWRWQPTHSDSRLWTEKVSKERGTVPILGEVRGDRCVKEHKSDTNHKMLIKFWQNWSKRKIKHYGVIQTKLMPFGVRIGPAMERFCNYSTGLGWVVSFMCWESVPRTCWGGCVSPSASLDTLENRKFSCPWQVYNHDSLIDQHAVSSLYGPRCLGF